MMYWLSRCINSLATLGVKRLTLLCVFGWLMFAAETILLPLPIR